MNIIVLGGTRFLGRHLAERLVSRGHDVTLYHRGTTLPDGIEGVRNVVGDRDAPLDAPGRHYDVVVDTCGFSPKQIEHSAAYFKENSPNASYAFVSSVSAYADGLAPDADEDAALWPRDGLGDAPVTAETYGPLKAGCERVVAREYPSHALVVRPGLIVGPWDRSDRFTYWVRRLSRGGDVLVPGRPERRVQIIDARDLACWIVTLLERRVFGTFNATGPKDPLSFGGVIAACAAAGRSEHRLHWASERFLIDAGVQPWTELPLWIPEDEGVGFSAISSARAQASGLTYRPLEETIADTLAWDRARASPALVNGLSADREAELLEKLRRTAT